MSVQPASDSELMLTTMVAQELYDYITSYALNGSNTRNPFDLDTETTEDEGQTLMRMYCGDEVASRMEVLPNETRMELDNEWRASTVNAFRDFAIRYNENPLNVEKIDIPDPSLPEREAYEAVSAYLAQENENSEMGETPANDFIDEWFNEKKCIFEIRCRPGHDDDFELDIAFNSHGEDFPGNFDKVIFSRLVPQSEIEQYVVSAGNPDKGFENLARDIINECKEAQKEEEESSLSPGR